jgi:hypothetical protein
MSRRTQIGVLVALLVLLVVVYLWNRNEVPGFQGVSQADTSKFTPLDVQAPDLRLDLLAKIHDTVYTGSNRDIFNGSAPPPSAAKPQPGQPAKLVARKLVGAPYPSTPAPHVEPPLPPVAVPAQFFGYATRPGGTKRVAFFLQGEDVIVVAEGDAFLGNYRLVHIGNESADVEEMSSGRHATVMLERPPDEAVNQ